LVNIRDLSGFCNRHTHTHTHRERERGREREREVAPVGSGSVYDKREGECLEMI
jgi:hypothetical protein